MPRRRGMRRNYQNYVDLADLVVRNCAQHRHHPYNLRPTTIRRQPGSMNERVLWQNQINPPPPDFDERHIMHRFSLSSRSRIYNMATMDAAPSEYAPPEIQAKAAKTAQRLNRMATAVIVTPQSETSSTKDENQFTVDETKSTVVLHHNPLFDAEGAKRSGLLTKKPSSKEAQKKIAKKKRASAKGSNGSKQFSHASASAARRNRSERAKLELDASSSFGRDFTRVDTKKKSTARIKSEQVDIDVVGSGENKDQELAPPPPPPMFPNVQAANCSTLAAILESVDNFLRNVKKS